MLTRLPLVPASRPLALCRCMNDTDACCATLVPALPGGPTCDQAQMPSCVTSSTSV